MHKFIVDCMKAAGCVESQADSVGRMLLDADSRGHYSHGVNRLPIYVRDLQTGICKRDGQPFVSRRKGGTALVDGDNALGSVVGEFCMGLAIELAKEHGVGWVSAHNSNHFGTAGRYAQMASNLGFIGMAFTNTSPLSFPTRSSAKALGTNPLAVYAPGQAHDGFSLDMATSTVALGKIEMARRKGTKLLPGWGANDKGIMSDDPDKVLDGGGLLLLGGTEESGGYKGTGLCMMVDILCGVLSGAHYGKNVRGWAKTTKKADLGQSFIVLDPECFAPDFVVRMQAYLDEFRHLDPVDPNRPVRIPGDFSNQHIERSKAEGGLLYHKNQMDHMKELAEEIGMPELQFSSDQIQKLSLIAVGIYKRDRSGKITDDFKKIAGMLYFTVGHLSDSSDAEILKSEAEKRGVNKVLDKNGVFGSIKLLQKSKEIRENGELEKLIEDFLKTETVEEKKIEDVRKDYSSEEISNLGKILKNLESTQIENPAFFSLMESIKISIKIITEEVVFGGRILEKDHLNEGLRALNSCQSMPYEIISEYLRLQDPEAPNFSSIGSKELNFVLIGEEGKGKSTFVNALKYYLQYPTFQKALSSSNKFDVVCPVDFTLCFRENNGYFDLKVVFNPESSEEERNKFSFTINGVTYKFIIVNPSMDSVDFETDFKKLNIDSYLFFLKSTDSRLYPELLNSLKLISRGNIKKVKFIFTSCITSNFTPGLALDVFKKVKDKFNGIQHNGTIYCVDNFGYRYLCGFKQDSKCLEQLVEDEIFDSETCWKKSRTELIKLINDVSKMKIEKNVLPVSKFA
ncbi:hypothetical protein FO519_004880 [Halicephalobus sp. NKZ332]|nr:hypothetical protein FO519_004880 [Halicephalobus sp. NKZ332]